MFRLFDKANFDFLAVRRWAYGLTVAFLLPGMIVLGVRGLNESIEFTGGTVMQIKAKSPAITTASLRSAIEVGGIAEPEIQTFGAPDEFVVRARLSARAEVSERTTQETAAAVSQSLTTAFGANTFEITRIEAVGPKVGGELRSRALIAILLSFGATLVYLWVRFEWRFGIAAVVATAHDVLSTVAFMSFINLEVSLVVVAAILTIVGYSLNDTVITFDRVRENLHIYKRDRLYDILNRSINETLPRTVLSSGTTFAATLALLIFGGEVIRPFAWVMVFGIVTGTFSSMFIASPVLLAIERRWPGEDVRGAKTSTGASRTAAPAPPRPAGRGARTAAAD